MLTVVPYRSAKEIRGKRVLVLGLGAKGGSAHAARWLAEHGALVKVTDRKKEAELGESLGLLRGLPIAYALGEHREQDIRDADLILRNPAVPLEAPLLQLAERLGKPVTMDVALFFQFCPAPIAGVTGTRGKSTTVAVAAEILRRRRPDTVLAGNIEHSPLKDLDRVREDTPVVLELSSWQLEALEPMRRSPHWAVLTTILPDHLNRYPSMEAYTRAKETIVRYQGGDDVAVLPADDPAGERFTRLTPARRSWFSGRGAAAVRHQVSNTVRHLVSNEGNVVLRDGGREAVLLPWDALGGTGDHTKRNMLAGALLALEMGAPREDVVAVLREFCGMPNRLEIIRELDGRTFVNDTTATTPEAVIAALRAFPGRMLVLITGGTDKNLDYTALARALADATNLRALVFLAGSATQKVQRALATPGVAHAPKTPGVRGVTPGVTVGDMPEAVRRAWKASRSGEVILLSPGAASFEFFRDEFDRGEQFRAAVWGTRAEVIMT